MKKGLLVALCVMGVVFWGITTASAGIISWSILQTGGMAGKGAGSDGLLGTGDDTSGEKCNYSNATACAVTGSPTIGTYSFAKLNFVQSSSCVLANSGHNPGDTCNVNADCGVGLAICVDCNSGSGGLANTYFATNSVGGSKGLGTLTVNGCEGQVDYTNISIGTSEVLGGSGGGCMTLKAGAATGGAGCGVGPISTTTDMDLWVSTPIPACGFRAGVMPGIALAGRVYDAGAGAGATTCGYSIPQIDAIMSASGLGSGQYMLLVCGSGTLPSPLQSACLSGAAWNTKMLASTSASLATSCADECGGGGCMAGTAEGVE